MKASTRDNKLLTLTMRQQKESNKVIERLETIATSRAGIFTVKTQRHICPDSFESESKAIWIRFECSKFDKLRFYDCDRYWWAQWKFNRTRNVLSTVWSFCRLVFASPFIEINSKRFWFIKMGIRRALIVKIFSRLKSHNNVIKIYFIDR